MGYKPIADYGVIGDMHTAASEQPESIPVFGGSNEGIVESRAVFSGIAQGPAPLAPYPDAVREIGAPRSIGFAWRDSYAGHPHQHRPAWLFSQCPHSHHSRGFLSVRFIACCISPIPRIESPLLSDSPLSLPTRLSRTGLPSHLCFHAGTW